MNSKDNKLIYEQYECISEGMRWPSPAMAVYLIAMGTLPIAGYLGFLRQTGKEDQVPAVVSKVKEIKQQLPPPSEIAPIDPIEYGEGEWPDPATSQPSQSTGPAPDPGKRLIDLHLHYKAIGIYFPPSDNSAESRQQSRNRYKFLKDLIQSFIGKPPIYGTQQEWDQYIDKLHQIDIDKYLA
jgi:hypothetical protein